MKNSGIFVFFMETIRHLGFLLEVVKQGKDISVRTVSTLSKDKWRGTEGKQGKIKSTANYIHNGRKTEETSRSVRTERCNYRDGATGAGRGGWLLTGGLIPCLEC